MMFDAARRGGRLRTAGLLLLVACGGGGAGTPVGRPRFDPLSAVPAGYQAVSWFARDDAPIFGYLKTLPDGAPPCVAALVAQSEGYVQAQRPDGTPSLLDMLAASETDS